MKKGSHEPQPERFDSYIPTPDGNGFKIKGSNYIYKLDQLGGWKDQYGNYYNSNGEYDPDEPQGALSPEQLSERGGSEQDQYERLYGKGGYVDQSSSDDENYAHIRNMQKMAKNIQILQNYPIKTPLRIYFRNINFHMKPDEIYSLFSKKTAGIINIIFNLNQKNQRNGSGHCIIDNSDHAINLVKFQGEIVLERQMNFQVQTIQELLIDPLSQQQLKPYQFYQSKPKWDKEQDNKQWARKQPRKQTKQETKQQQKIESPKKEEKKEEIKQEKKEEIKQEKKGEQQKNDQQWKLYQFSISLFPKKQVFEDWMKNLGIIKGSDYKQLEARTRRSTGVKFGIIKMRSQILKICNKKQYEKNIVLFEQYKN